MTSQGDFVFSVSPEMEDNELITFQLDITADNGSWTYPDLNILVHAPVLVYESNVIDDIVGDGNGEPDPGETCDMTVTLKNEGSQEAIQVSADLSCDDPYVTVTASGSDYPDIPPDNSESSLVPYQFSVDSSCSLGHIAEFVLEVTGAGPYSASDTFQIKIGRKPVLLVDDDDGEDYDTFFVSALNSCGVSYDVWELDLLGSPSDSVLNPYKAVVWTTGDDCGFIGNPSTLTSEDQANLQAYLDNGGRLFLSSQDLLYDNDPNDFIIDYLHVSGHTDDSGINSVGGVSGDTISDGMAISLSYPFTNLSDYIIPGPDATGIFYRTGKTSITERRRTLTIPSLNPGESFLQDESAKVGNSDSQNFCALRYPATGTADYQVVFFVFPFEAVPQSGTNPNNAKAVMGKIMEWFGISKSFTRGDTNGDGDINIADVIFLVNYLFLDGPAPTPLAAGDADSSGEVDIADVIFLINYLFLDGPPPCY
jgi:hypothetical protein